MTNTKPKRKTRSDKFPLTLHKTGQYCKKIKGRVYYFGANKKIALERYLEQATYLHSGKSTPPNKVNFSLKQLCNLYLEHQHSKVQANEMTAEHYRDQVRSLRVFSRFIGIYRRSKDISTLDLQNYKRKLVRSYGSAHRVNLNISIMKAMFHWAKKNEILVHIPNIDAVSKTKIKPKEKRVFTLEEIKKLLDAADKQIKAMIWLGLNCGFGCTDCAQLCWSDLELDKARVKLARKKTNISRNLPLWPETVKALKQIPKQGKLVFYTSKGNVCVRTISTATKDGVVKYTNDNFISKKFAKLLKKTGIKTEKGVGFYTLRRTAATLAAKSGDPFAVQKLLGHADLKMATTYVQDVSEQTDKVINNSRKFIIQDGS